MSDFARLEDKLAKLRQRERIAGEGRRLRGSTPDDQLASVVAEIDETILPRRLSFAVEGGATIHLAVANRRLQALAPPPPELNDSAVSDLADRPLHDAEEPAVLGIRDLLLAAFADGAPVAIQSSRPPGAGHPSDVGVPANILARTWGVADASEEDISADAIISRFLSGLGDDAIAWLRIEGEDVTDQGGDPAAAETLGEHAAVFLDGYFGKFDKLYSDGGGACATMIGPMSGVGAAALFVEIGEVSAFVAAKAECAAEITGKWQQLFRG